MLSLKINVGQYSIKNSDLVGQLSSKEKFDRSYYDFGWPCIIEKQPMTSCYFELWNRTMQDVFHLYSCNST